MRSTCFKKEEKMGFAIGSEPGKSWTYFSTWPLPGMFVAHTHSLDIQKYWIWSIHITTKASLFSASCLPSAAAIMNDSVPAYPSLLPSTRDWAKFRDAPVTLPGSTAISDLSDHLSRVPLSRGGVGLRTGSSQEQIGAVIHDKSFIVPHTEKSYLALCCALIGEREWMCVFRRQTLTISSCIPTSAAGRSSRRANISDVKVKHRALLPGRQRGIVWISSRYHYRLYGELCVRLDRDIEHLEYEHRLWRHRKERGHNIQV